MKNSILIGLVSLSLSAFGQMREETIRKEYSFEKESPGNVFQLANITGFIKVEVHSGSNYILEARKQVIAKTSDRLDIGMEETTISLLDRFDTLIVYAASPCHNVEKQDWNSANKYSYTYNDCNLKYDYKFDMTLKVPKNANLILSTVNDGDIEVRGVSGALKVSNVNGAILLDKIDGKVVAHTINGDLDLNYSNNPNQDSRYYTLNGDINANFKPGLAAKISFKSFNGDMYTNLAILEPVPGQLTTSKVVDQEGVKYKIEDRKVVQARNGTVMLDFETFNGDAIIKEK